MQNPMRIAIINQHPDEVLGGSEVQCELIARGLAERGHAVHYIAPSRSQVQPEGIAYEVHPVPHDAKAIAEVVTRIQADVVYWRFNKRCFRGAARRLWRAGVPIVFAAAHINDLLPWSAKSTGSGHGVRQLRALRQRLVSRWHHGGLRYVDQVTTNNPEYLRLMPSGRGVYVPNAMLTDVVAFDWPRPFCLWVANIKPDKQPQRFVELARALASTGLDFLMVGHIQHDAYHWLTDRSSVPANFHYLGPRTVEQVNGMLAAARLHVHTCLPEGFSNIFIQAWLQGRASVSLAFDPGGYLTSERIGRCAHGDWDRFVNDVKALACDGSDEMGKRAQAFAQRMFAPERLVDAVEQVLTQVVRQYDQKK